MRTIMENKGNVGHEVIWDVVNDCEVEEDDDESLVCSSFYDFGASHALTFGGYVKKKRSRFIDNL